MNTATLTFDPTGWLEINYTQTVEGEGGTQTITLQSTSYHPTQLELIHADCAKLGVVIAGDDAQAIAEWVAEWWVADYVPPASAPVPVPQVLTARQAKLVLHNAGLLDDVDAAVAASDKAQGMNLKPPAPNPKTKKDAARRESYCARSAGQAKMFPEAAKDPESRLNKARKAWNC